MVNAFTRTTLVTICSEGYFKANFLYEDYFGDYFQFGNYFLKKIISKIVSNWQINLKITLRKKVNEIILVDALTFKYVS